MFAIKLPLCDQSITIYAWRRGRFGSRTGIVSSIEIYRVLAYHDAQPIKIKMRIPRLHWVPRPSYKRPAFVQGAIPLGPFQNRSYAVILKFARNSHHV